MKMYLMMILSLRKFTRAPWRRWRLGSPHFRQGLLTLGSHYLAGLYKLFVSNRLTLKSVLMFTNSHFLTDWLTDCALKYLVPEALLLGSYSVWPGSVSGINYFLEATFEIEDYFDVHIFTLSECLWLRVCCPRNTLLGVLWICVARECLRDGIFLAILPLETLYSGQYHHFTSHDIRSKLFLVTCDLCLMGGRLTECVLNLLCSMTI